MIVGYDYKVVFIVSSENISAVCRGRFTRLIKFVLGGRSDKTCSMSIPWFMKTTEQTWSKSTLESLKSDVLLDAFLKLNLKIA